MIFNVRTTRKNLYSSLSCWGAVPEWVQVDSHLHVRTRDQHGGNYFSVLKHVDDVALEIFTAVGLQVAAPKWTRGEGIKVKNLTITIKWNLQLGHLLPWARAWEGECMHFFTCVTAMKEEAYSHPQSGWNLACRYLGKSLHHMSAPAVKAKSAAAAAGSQQPSSS